MDTHAAGAALDADDIGAAMYRAVEDLYPICRSITGQGLRQTLRYIQKQIPLELREVASGTPVFDWTVPKEWNVRDAYIADARGQRIVDFKRSNLHLLSYSTPIRARMSLGELRPHLYTLPESPDWIPYRTSYYEETWGFCLTHRQLLTLADEEYEVCIDSTLEAGHLTYGECYLPGASADEVLISCHACHPSLANDNLSGVALAMFLARHLAGRALRYSYRFLFLPGTIGSITWLALNEARVDRIKHGLVLAGVGDGGALTYKKSRRGDAEIDRAITHVLRQRGTTSRIEEFSPYGYDERQFCSPGFNLPVGCLMRTPYGQYPEYHTSADNLDLVRPVALADSLQACLAVVEVLEGNRRYINQNPKCEPQLGKRGLYNPVGGAGNTARDTLTMLWVLNLSDGDHSLLEVVERSGRPFAAVKAAADALLAGGLLKEA